MLMRRKRYSTYLLPVLGTRNVRAMVWAGAFATLDAENVPSRRWYESTLARALALEVMLLSTPVQAPSERSAP